MAGAVLAGVLVAVFLFWIVLGIGGPRPTLWVDDVGQALAAWCATAVCAVAARRLSTGRPTWALLAASSFAWGAGEVVWCYYALMRNVPVPFPSLADVGFLTAVPLTFAALLLFPDGQRRPAGRVQGLVDGCIIALSLLLASWATILGPLYRSHQGGVLKQVISLAYPTSDVVMASLVVILIARAGPLRRMSLALVMAGVVAFAVADSAFAYLTEVNGYGGGSFLDTGWVAGFLLIALGALWAATSPVHQVEQAGVPTTSIIAPQVPVLVVLMATAVELLRTRHIDAVSAVLAFSLVLLVLGRQLLNLWSRRLAVAEPGNGQSPSRRSDSDALSVGR